MKKRGILNAQLMSELTKLRHTDKMVICDAGFPIPKDATVVDVSLIAGVPTLPQVLKAVLNEIIVEEANKEYYDFVKETFKDKQKYSEVSMPEFQKMTADAKFYVRTGELAPCSNIMLVSASGVDIFCDPMDISFEE